MSDLHGMPGYAEACVRFVLTHEPDAVVLAGDLLRPMGEAGSLEEKFRAYARRLADELDPIPCPLYWIMGNDDLVEWDPPQERFRPIHGRRLMQDGFSLSVPTKGSEYW